MSDVIVVGAGLAGLAAAYEVRRMGADVVVLESEHRPGGVVVTENVEGGWVVEGGPDSFLPSDGTVAAISEMLGIADRVVRQAAHGAAVWTGQALQSLSEGDAAAVLGIQVKPEDLKADHLSYLRGMTELVEALAAAIAPSLRLRVGVSGVSPTHDGFRLSVTGGSTVSGSTLILALPAWRAAQLLWGIEPRAAEALGVIRYAPSLTVSLAYRAGQVGAPLEGTGFVVAAPGSVLRACTYASSKFPGRAPAGHVLVRAFITEPAGSAADAAHRALAPILKLSGAPLWSRTYAWPRGIPFYAPDHQTMVASARRRLGRLGNLLLAGAGYDGAGVGACVKSGLEAGQQLSKASRKVVQERRRGVP